MNRILILILLFVFLIQGCAPTSIDSTLLNAEYPSSVELSTNNGYPEPNMAYPRPATNEMSATPKYPDPNQEAITMMATQGPEPTPSSDSGVVTGALFLQGKPVQNVNIYLAEMIKDSNGEESIATYDRTSSPRAFTDSDGNFVFSNVQPGNYSLILDIIVNSFLLGHPNGSGPILLTVKAAETYKLGKLDYTELPIPQ